MRRTSLISVLFFSLVMGLFLFHTPLVHAVDDLKSNSVIPDLNLQIPIFNKDKIPVAHYDNGDVVFTGLTDYVNLAYNWLVGAVGILVVISLMYGGVLWMTAGGNASNISKAQDIMRNALIGLGLVLGSYLILSTINPELVELRPIRLAKQKAIDININVEVPHASKQTQDSVGGNVTTTGDSADVQKLLQEKKLVFQCVGDNTCAAQQSGRWESGIAQKPPMPVDTRILGALKIVGDACPGTLITALNESAGHSDGSYHYVGKAVDIGGTICGAIPEACNTAQSQLVQKLLSLGYSVGTPGGACGGFKDAPGHFHINVR